MDRLRIVAYRPEHLEEIQLRPEQVADRPEKVDGEAITFIFEERPIAIVGWRILAVGILQVWALISDAVKECPVRFHRALLLLVAHGFDVLSLRRMQMSVRVGFSEGWNWAKALGFVCEGTMQRYATDGAPCWLFARTSP